MGSIDANSERTYPLQRPAGHKVPVPRWTLQLPESVTHIYTLYVGVQSHDSAPGSGAAGRAEAAVEARLFDSSDGTPAPVVDTFRVTEGHDVVGAKVWVGYWTSAAGLEAAVSRLALAQLWRDLGPDRAAVGVWTEHFVTPVDRLETNYARLDHKPGLAQLPGATQPGHELTAYWGAGRDRIPASAHDRFETPTAAVAGPGPGAKNPTASPRPAPRGRGERVRGTNYAHMCHIRSGQWWEQCAAEERAAYEDDLQQTLMTGMRYLWEHPEETGTIGLRFVQNLDPDGRPRRETAGVGFHRNWADLERWASRHPSHLAIFNGAMKHAKRFGEDRKFMTWHEVSILKAGEATFDYVNCDPRTGVMKWVELEAEPLAV